MAQLVRAYKPKVKTGCLTCRKRRIKCDEAKPYCLNCTKTGRTCNGYESNFVGPGLPRRVTAVRAAAVVQSISHTSAFSSFDIRNAATQLGFIHKPLYGLNYTCEVEATGILISSRSEPAIRYALLSMSALREKYAKYGDYRTIKTHHAHELRPVYESYNAAIHTLTRKLSRGGPDAAEAALYCCQLFISIECMQHNYSSAMQQLAQGLRIMQDWHVRSYLNDHGGLMAPVNPNLPCVDMFALKLFFAPCPGSRRITQCIETEERPLTPMEITAIAMVQDPVRTQHIRNGKSRLHSIANTVFDFLIDSKRPEPHKLELGARKCDLLNQLDKWAASTSHLLQKDGTVWPVRIDEVAMFLFHQVLHVVVTSCLSPGGDKASVELQIRDMLRTAEVLTKIRAESLTIR